MPTRSIPLLTDEQLIELLKKGDRKAGDAPAWAADFKGVGAMRGIGWAALVRDPVADRLFNIWVDEHHVGHFASCPILLIMDVFEHAFMLDYGLKRADYLNAFWKNVDWTKVEDRVVV